MCVCVCVRVWMCIQCLWVKSIVSKASHWVHDTWLGGYIPQPSSCTASEKTETHLQTAAKPTSCQVFLHKVEDGCESAGHQLLEGHPVLLLLLLLWLARSLCLCCLHPVLLLLLLLWLARSLCLCCLHPLILEGCKVHSMILDRVLANKGAEGVGFQWVQPL